ncbi:MAG: hypothetical protein RR139_12135, partial [Lachnospiraceae bacterium]
KSFDDVSIVPTFVLQPLTYLGGVFYSNSDAGGVVSGAFGAHLCSFVDGLFVFSCALSLALN